MMKTEDVWAKRLLHGENNSSQVAHCFAMAGMSNALRNQSTITPSMELERTRADQSQRVQLLEHVIMQNSKQVQQPQT